MKEEALTQVQEYILGRLEKELSPSLFYHNLSHTRDEVVPAAERLAKMEGVEGKSLLLLLTAAWFHDLGHVEQSIYHELISARIAIEVLPQFGFNSEQVEVVRWAILATALPQSPRSLLEQIIADSDLFLLGSKKFAVRNIDLRRELSMLGKDFSDEEWIANQIKFLEGHKYFTASAEKLCNTGKAENVKYLKSLLAEKRSK